MSKKFITILDYFPWLIDSQNRSIFHNAHFNYQISVQVQRLMELPVPRKGASKLKILASIGAVSAVVASGIYIWGKK